MQFNEYQKLAARTEKLPTNLTPSALYAYRLNHASLGVASEIGELAGAIKSHIIYNKALDVDNAKEEIGDILWYLAVYMNTLDLSFEDIAQHNIDKLRKRYPDKYTDESALARMDKVYETAPDMTHMHMMFDGNGHTHTHFWPETE